MWPAYSPQVPEEKVTGRGILGPRPSGLAQELGSSNARVEECQKMQ